MKRHTVDVGIAAIMWLAVLTIREGRSRVPISKTERLSHRRGPFARCSRALEIIVGPLREFVGRKPSGHPQDGVLVRSHLINDGEPTPSPFQ
jgi:hypothetical protein